MAESTSSSGKACQACKQSKRRCDKVFPQCSLCQRAGRNCDYSENPSLPLTAEDYAQMKARLDDVEKRIAVLSSVASSSTPALISNVNEPIDVRPAEKVIISTPSFEPEAIAADHAHFPAALFLDIDCFMMARMQLPLPSSACVPMDVLAILNEGNVVIDTIEAYFSTAHSWLPILSKKRMDIGIPTHEAGADLALLILAMKLVISLPSDLARNNNLYCILKNFAAGLERHGTVSLVYLQALILIAVYEYGHAIYPAAWMTVGACARFSHVLGLLCAGTDEFWASQATTWTEVEERRRAWWAIFILDRLISMGSRRPCCLSSPLPADKLPAADYAWESGNVAAAISVSVATDFSAPQFPFASLCKAAIYVDRALKCVQDLDTRKDTDIAEVDSLTSEIRGFHTRLGRSLENSHAPAFPLLSAAQCIAQAAIFQVLDTLTCPEKLRPGAGYGTSADTKTPSEINLQVYATSSVQETCNQVQALCAQLTTTLSSRPDKLLATISPFVLHAVYNTVATLYWYVSESGDPAHQAGIEELSFFMQAASKRWRLASTYMELGELWDATKRKHMRC